MTEEQARKLFREHCLPGQSGVLEAYGERAAVSAIMCLASPAPQAPDVSGLVEAARGVLNSMKRPGSRMCFRDDEGDTWEEYHEVPDQALNALSDALAQAQQVKP